MNRLGLRSPEGSLNRTGIPNGALTPSDVNEAVDAMRLADLLAHQMTQTFEGDRLTRPGDP